MLNVKMSEISEHIIDNDESEEFCRCPCHKPFVEVCHPVPCCSICPKCKKRIAIGFIEIHHKKCSAT